jgi:hypothetical protein
VLTQFVCVFGGGGEMASLCMCMLMGSSYIHGRRFMGLSAQLAVAFGLGLRGWGCGVALCYDEHTHAVGQEAYSPP